MVSICTVGQYWRERFGKKVYRVGIDGGFTCPTRDGTKGRGGCYFCDEEGSRASHIRLSDGIEKQIELGICKLKKKGINSFVSYFQSYTSTYASVDILREKYIIALSNPDVVGISVSTRPDCINKENVNLLNEIAEEHYTIVELGVQSVHQKSLDLAGRKHTVSDSEEAVKMLKQSGKIEVVAHVILGLPGETDDDMLETARVLSKWNVDGVKLHHLYIVEGTPFSKLFSNKDIKVYKNPEDYAEIAKKFIRNLSDNIIIHRFSGYANNDRLIAPEWTRDRHVARNLILEMF